MRKAFLDAQSFLTKGWKRFQQTETQSKQKLRDLSWQKLLKVRALFGQSICGRLGPRNKSTI